MQVVCCAGKTTTKTDAAIFRSSRQSDYITLPVFVQIITYEEQVALERHCKSPTL